MADALAELERQAPTCTGEKGLARYVERGKSGSSALCVMEDAGAQLRGNLGAQRPIELGILCRWHRLQLEIVGYREASAPVL